MFKNPEPARQGCDSEAPKLRDRFGGEAGGHVLDRRLEARLRGRTSQTVDSDCKTRIRKPNAVISNAATRLIGVWLDH